MEIDPTAIYFTTEEPLPSIVHDDWVGPVAIARVSGTKEERGLVTTREVSPGELLLISNPMVSADIGKVFHSFMAAVHEKEGPGRPLAEIAEEELIDRLGEVVEASGEACEVVLSMADGDKTELPIPPDIHLLTKRGEAMKPGGVKEKLGRDYLRRITRANAFGPDFKLFHNMEQEWQETGALGKFFRRVVGLYVLPAMINHSCTANACRVFVGETMFVRCTQKLQAGEEVLWPYVFPLEPVEDRQEKLQRVLGFKCGCGRCEAEVAMPPAYRDYCRRSWEIRRRGEKGEDVREELVSFVQQLEEFLATSSPDAQVRRWCRASFLNVYFNRFNCLGSAAVTPDECEQVLKAATDLYWSLWVVNPCSTEHLSLLHVCYELAVHRDGNHSRLATFWFTQLKKAHLTRYGPMDLEAFRGLLQQTKIVLRNLNGLKIAPYSFI